jgi:hypothetical protein
MSGILKITVARALDAVLARFGADQLFLFASNGDPFWVAREPVSQEEMHVFTEALDFLAELETTKEKPFAAESPDRTYSVAALAPDSDLFVVLIDRGPQKLGAEARVGLVRADLAPRLEHLRTSALRALITS